MSVILKAADRLRFQTKLWTNSPPIDSFPTAIFGINACPSHYTMKQEPPRALNNLSPRREENTNERKATSSLSHSLSHSPFGPEADLVLSHPSLHHSPSKRPLNPRSLSPRFLTSSGVPSSTLVSLLPFLIFPLSYEVILLFDVIKS